MKEQKRTPPEYIETEYGLIQIEETTSRGEPVRLYRHDGAFSSGTFLREEKKYNVIFNDAFSGKTPVKKLATLEAVMAYRDHLNEGGIYMANVIGRVFGEGSEFVKSAVATVSRVFRHVHVLYTNPYEKDGINRDNYMIMATDRDILPNDRMHYHISRFDRVLTDADG